ncbi:PIN domain protein [Treponema socranskii]|uniref:PIN domain protein n=2 Tax=Treponema socranskii TaxID=53419 RepID=UPI003D6E3E71
MIERRACIKARRFFTAQIHFLRLQYGHDIVILMKIYLDNCCYNRPFDDQTALKVHLEAIAKLAIQADIKCGVHKLVWSYIMDYENAHNPYDEKRRTIGAWKEIASEVIDTETKDILDYAEKLAANGIKSFDALHLSCAINAHCDYFLTTDRQLLSLLLPEIKIANPIRFISETGGAE